MADTPQKVWLLWSDGHFSVTRSLQGQLGHDQVRPAYDHCVWSSSHLSRPLRGPGLIWSHGVQIIYFAPTTFASTNILSLWEVNFFQAIFVDELDSFFVRVRVFHLKRIQQFIIVMKSFKESKIFMWLWPWKYAYEIICLWKLFCSFYQDADIVSCQVFQNLILVWIPIEVFVGENCLLLLALLVQLWTINCRVELKRRFAWNSVRTCLMLILISKTYKCSGKYWAFCRQSPAFLGLKQHWAAHGNPRCGTSRLSRKRRFQG